MCRCSVSMHIRHFGEGETMKKIVLMVCIFVMLCQVGCGKNVFINESEDDTLEFVLEEIEISSNNSDDYSKIAVIQDRKNEPELMHYDSSYSKYGRASAALIWKLERNNDSDEKIHVIVSCEMWNLSDDEIEGELTKVITEFNSNQNMEINDKDWKYLECSRFYARLSEKEILGLANQGDFRIMYIGSNNVDYKDLDLTTPEGVDVYIELFGDGYVQCVNGKEIKDYTE